jgi:hypothetical protein
MASITDSHFLSDSKVWQWHCLRGTLLVKYLATVATMMFAICEAEGGPASEADVRINPFWGGLSVYHCRIGDRQILWWEVESYWP